MSDGDDDIVVVASDTTVELYPARSFKMYTVIEHELDALQQAGEDENTALAFATLSIGVLIGGSLGWLTASRLSPVVAAAYAAIMAVLLISSCWFSIKWLRARATRRKKLMGIRQTSGIPQKLQLTPAAPKAIIRQDRG